MHRLGTENAAGAKFCSECGARLIAAARPVEERKLVTVVFCDLVGSTARAVQLDPKTSVPSSRRTTRASGLSDRHLTKAQGRRCVRLGWTVQLQITPRSG
jgi:hypothetical protein